MLFAVFNLADLLPETAKDPVAEELLVGPLGEAGGLFASAGPGRLRLCLGAAPGLSEVLRRSVLLADCPVAQALEATAVPLEHLRVVLLLNVA